MLNKKLKYQLYLDNYTNCPSDDFKEISGQFCRWVSADGNENENDFKPVSLIKEPPQRLLSDADKLCMSYGLSFFIDLQKAVTRYSELYNKSRAHLKEIWKKDKGTYIALIDIENDDGVGDEPHTESGHFTFHEYNDVDLTKKIKQTISIFAEDGTIINT